MRGLILAFQFLTRLPMPALDDVKKTELAGSAVWFPLVGLSLGVLLVVAGALGEYANTWVAALLVVLVWIAVTGALHLDGAADLADALGATHASADDDSERFLSVLKDPHLGTFGAVVLISILLTKWVAVASLLESNASYWLLFFIPAWARLGSVYWGQTVKALAAGHGESFALQSVHAYVWFWGVALFVLSGMLVSFAFAVLCMVSVLLWRVFLQWRIGGMNGDCLGAGIEYCECAMLLAATFIL